MLQTTAAQRKCCASVYSVVLERSMQRVFKGMRMGGRMGGDSVKVISLRVLKVIPESNLLIVKGSVPGAKGSYLIIER